MAGVVVSAEKGVLVLLDEYGGFESKSMTARGVVEGRHGVTVLANGRAADWHPGVLQMKQA